MKKHRRDMPSPSVANVYAVLAFGENTAKRIDRPVYVMTTKELIKGLHGLGFSKRACKKAVAKTLEIGLIKRMRRGSKFITHA